MVGLLRQTLLQNLDVFSKSQVEGAAHDGADQSLQSALPHDDVEVILQTVEAEVAGKRAAPFDLVLGQTNGAFEHGRALVAQQLHVLFIDFSKLFHHRGQVIDVDRPAPSEHRLQPWTRSGTCITWSEAS